VSADSPLFKINNPKVRDFLPKYTHTDPPDESTLRKTIYLIAMKKHWTVIGVLKNDQMLSEK
jgi:hypothetical protein